MTITLYPFRYRDPLTGRWIKARYKATREDIAAGHAEWEIIGPAEVRDPDASARRFDPTAPSISRRSSIRTSTPTSAS